MSKTIFIFLVVFSFFVFLNSSYSFEITYPLKTDLVDEAMQEGQIAVKNYRSLLDQGKILQFYQNSLDREGWQEVDSLSLDRAKSIPEVRIYGFARGEEALILEFSPFAVEGLVFYTIRMGEVSKIFASQGENAQVLGSEEDVESLKDILIYPGAVRFYYVKSDVGSEVNYKTNDSAEEIQEFYRQEMPKFKWDFVGKKDVAKDDFYKFDNGKIDEAKIKKVADIDVKGVRLEFKKENKRCFVTISRLKDTFHFETEVNIPAVLDETIIAVSYEEKK